MIWALSLAASTSAIILPRGIYTARRKRTRDRERSTLLAAQKQRIVAAAAESRKRWLGFPIACKYLMGIGLQSAAATAARI